MNHLPRGHNEYLLALKSSCDSATVMFTTRDPNLRSAFSKKADTFWWNGLRVAVTTHVVALAGIDSRKDLATSPVWVLREVP